METSEALDALRETYMDGFNDGDVEAVMSVHTEDTIHMPAGMPPVTGKEAVRALMQESLRRVPEGFRFEFEPLDVRIADEFAVERGVTEGVGEIPGGKYVLLYERQDDGCWRIAWTITNSDAPR